MVTISSRPYFTNDFAFLRCFRILIGLDILVLANEISPYQRHANHGNQPCYTLSVAHMCVLNIESGRFHARYTRLCHNRVKALQAGDTSLTAAPGQIMVELPSGLWVVRAGVLAAKAVVK